MDILSHGLWATAVAKGVNLKSTKKIKLGWMALWGISPDIFSFAPVIIWMLWQMFYKGVDFGDIPRPETMPPEVRNSFYIFRFTKTLYHISHSFIIFLALFFLAWIIYWYKLKNKQKSEIIAHKQMYHQTSRCTPYWEMTGWFIHIVMDILTHSEAFYPTLFLWPLSDWCFDGVSWVNMRFVIINYTFLLIVFTLLRFLRQIKVK
jgi:hypothetical protein